MHSLAADSRLSQKSWYALSMFDVSGGDNLSTDSSVRRQKDIPVSLAKVPNLHRIAVGRNLELRWCYEGRLML